jgi:photosystem II stability/assembly factor-like uncharacterized protein
MTKRSSPQSWHRLLRIIMIAVLGTIYSAVSGLAFFPMSQEHGWFWLFKHPPCELVLYNEYPYYIPGVGIYEWVGEGHKSLLAHTGKPVDYDPFNPVGLYRSDDDGLTWTFLGQIDPSNEVNVIKSHPITPSLLFAGSNNHSPPGGIYRSENSGESWQNVLANKIIYDIEIDPIKPNRMYASTCCLPETTGGIYRSEDAGLTWELISTEWLYDLEPHPTEENTIFGARYFSTASEEGIYRSENAGDSWKKISFLGGQRYLKIDPHEPDRMFAYGRDYGGVWRTEDGGENWENITEGLPDPVAPQTILILAIDPTRENTVWVGLKYGGMFVTHDNGNTWYEANRNIPFYGGSINGPQCITIAISPTGKVAIGCDAGAYIGLEIYEVFLPALQ